MEERRRPARGGGERKEEAWTEVNVSDRVTVSNSARKAMATKLEPVSINLEKLTPEPPGNMLSSQQPGLELCESESRP